MKIEKVNDHQIRCTLTREDLADREIKISELAYGTAKAKSLFRDMMQQAACEFGFEAEDIPLMIEAIPLNSECIVLIITKVEDPEELDTRFSKFAPSLHEDMADADVDDNIGEDYFDDTDDVLNMLRKMSDANSENSGNAIAKKGVNASISTEGADKAKGNRIFSFSSMYEVTRFAKLAASFYEGKTDLFKDNEKHDYLLVFHATPDAYTAFNKVCNMASEYGSIQRASYYTKAHLEEYCEVLIKDEALSKLSLLA